MSPVKSPAETYQELLYKIPLRWHLSNVHLTIRQYCRGTVLNLLEIVTSLAQCHPNLLDVVSELGIILPTYMSLLQNWVDTR